MPDQPPTRKSPLRRALVPGAAGAGLFGLGLLARKLVEDNPVNEELPAAARAHVNEVNAGPDQPDRVLAYLRLGELLNRKTIGDATGLDAMEWLRTPSPLNPRFLTRQVPGFTLDWGQPWDDPSGRLIDDHYKRFAEGPAAGLEQLAWEHMRPGSYGAFETGMDHTGVAAGLNALTPRYPDQDARVKAYFGTAEGRRVAGHLDRIGVPVSSEAYAQLAEKATPAAATAGKVIPNSLLGVGAGLMGFAGGRALAAKKTASNPEGGGVSEFLPPDDGDLLLAVFCGRKSAGTSEFDVQPPPAAQPTPQPGVLPWLRRNPWPVAAGAAGLGGLAGSVMTGKPKPAATPNTVHPNTAPADDADDVGQEGGVKGAAEPPPGPQQAVNAGRSVGAGYPAAAGFLAGQDYSDAAMPLRGAWARLHGGAAGGTQLREGVKYVSPAMRWGANLLPDELASLVDVGATFGDPRNTGRAYESFATHVAPHGDKPPRLTPADFEALEKARALTPRTLMNAADVVARDADIAVHRYNRAEHPGHYWANPLVRSGPLHEMLDRLRRRASAEKADPDAAARWSLYVPGVPIARGLLAGRSGEKIEKARRLGHTVVADDEGETEKKAYIGEGLVKEYAAPFAESVAAGAKDLYAKGMRTAGEAAGKVVSSEVGKGIGDLPGQIGQYAANNPWARYALYGAPIGAGVGLLGGLMGRKRNKWKAVGDAMTGGLLGGVGGAAVGGAQQLWDGGPQNASSRTPAPPGLKPFDPNATLQQQGAGAGAGAGATPPPLLRTVSPALASTGPQNQAEDFARRQYELTKGTSGGLAGRAPEAAGGLVNAQNATTDQLNKFRGTGANGPDLAAASQNVRDAQRAALGQLPPGLAALTGGAGVGAADATNAELWRRPDEAARALPAALGGAGAFAAAPVAGEDERARLIADLGGLDDAAKRLQARGVDPYGNNPGGPLGSVLLRNALAGTAASTGAGALWNRYKNTPDKMIANLAERVSVGPGDSFGGGIAGGGPVQRFLTGQPPASVYGPSAADSPLFAQRLANQLALQKNEPPDVEKIREALRSGSKLPVDIGQAAKALQTDGGRVSLGQVAGSEDVVKRLTDEATKNIKIPDWEGRVPPVEIPPPVATPAPRYNPLSGYTPETPTPDLPAAPEIPRPSGFTGPPRRTAYTPEEVRDMLVKGDTDAAVNKALENMFAGVKVQNGKLVDIPGTAAGTLQAGGGRGAGFTGMSASTNPLVRGARAVVSPLNLLTQAALLRHTLSRPSASLPEQGVEAMLERLGAYGSPGVTSVPQAARK